MRAEALRRAKDGTLDDDQLQQLITERLDEDPTFWTGTGKNKSRAAIVVEVNDGEATLTGVVRTPMDRRRADILARALGASSVDNRLRVSGDVTAPKPRRVA